jgi:DNA-binding response OmpR family regulator
MDEKNLSGLCPGSRRVWILEDDPDIGYLVQLFLSYEGFEASLYNTAHDFRTALKSEPPGIFLLDVMLPDGDGTCICREIKNDSHLKSIPVLMMSAHADADLICKCNPDGFIPKPFDLEKMLMVINQQLAAH